MAFEISVKLEESELDYFREVMRKVRTNLGSLTEQQILAKAGNLFGDVKGELPGFISSRLSKLEALIDMVNDEQWELPEQQKEDVLSALAYFCEAEDLIPDHIPALGFLDDAIMIELIVVELGDDIDAYEEFCQYRQRQQDDNVTTDEWLASKRRELHSRMKHRRRSREGRRSGFRSIF
jgi:uncharacterized membrane protein YkvA (DUF1232 family)